MADEIQTPTQEASTSRFSGLLAGIVSALAPLRNLISRITGGASEAAPDAGAEGPAVTERVGEAAEHVSHAVEAGVDRVKEAAGKIDLPDGVEEKVDEVREKAAGMLSRVTKDMDPEKLQQVKEKGGMVGGGILAVDGVRRMAKKDKEGKRHVVKGAVETAAGVGLITASVLARRAGQGQSAENASSPPAENGPHVTALLARSNDGQGGPGR